MNFAPSPIAPRGIHLRSNERLVLLTLAGEVGRFALIAYKVDRLAVLRPLEYHLLRHVVHAGLAKVVHWVSLLMSFVGRQHEDAPGKLMQVVLRPLTPMAFELSQACLGLSLPLSERIALCFLRREFRLKVKRGISDFEYALIERDQRVLDFRLIARFRDDAEQIKSGLGR